MGNVYFMGMELPWRDHICCIKIAGNVRNVIGKKKKKTQCGLFINGVGNIKKHKACGMLLPLISFHIFLQLLMLNCLQTRLSVICAASGLEVLTIQIWNQLNESCSMASQLQEFSRPAFPKRCICIAPFTDH